MKRMSTSDYTIELLEKILVKLTEIEQRLDAQDKRMNRHETTKHVFRSAGKHQTSLQDTQVNSRY